MRQLALLELPPAAAPAAWEEWTGHKGPNGRNRAWTHPRLPPGVRVLHCGHPTALWPYYVEGIDSLGTFGHLRDAQASALLGRRTLPSYNLGVKP